MAAFGFGRAAAFLFVKAVNQEGVILFRPLRRQYATIII